LRMARKREHQRRNENDNCHRMLHGILLLPFFADGEL
jgi:hypothetical protein